MAAGLGAAGVSILAGLGVGLRTGVGSGWIGAAGSTGLAGAGAGWANGASGLREGLTVGLAFDLDATGSGRVAGAA